MVHFAKRNANRCPTHPGALLREDVIPATGRTKAEIAHLLGISRQHRAQTGVSRGGGPARQIVWRRRRSLGPHAGRIRYMECRAQRGCQRDSHSAPKWRRSRYRQLETGPHDVRRATLEVIARAFKDAGVEFIDENGGGPGLRLRKRH